MADSFYQLFFDSQRPGSIQADCLLRENIQPFRNERFLQAIWFHQRLVPEQLRLTNGQSLRVLHPGFWNHGHGPDFQQAMLQIDGSLVTGDVEIDLASAGWRAHHHDSNLDFQNVVLHVVWREEEPDRLPTLEMSRFLDASLGQLEAWLADLDWMAWPEVLRGKCHVPLRALSVAETNDLLTEAAWVRFERKGAAMAARASVVGWERCLWEATFCGLGYQFNRWPMQKIAQATPLWDSQEKSPSRCQALLFGIAGLLPRSISGSPLQRQFVRSLWDIWWHEQDRFADWILPASVWHFKSIRPANHPQRRIALASHWLADPEWVRKIEAWGRQSIPHRKMSGELYDLLHVAHDPFWRRHWTFHHAAPVEYLPLFGAARLTDLAANVFLPWLCKRAEALGQFSTAEEIRGRYAAWPAVGDNQLIRFARERLSAGTLELTTAMSQQGLLQIVSDFCRRSNSACDHCILPTWIASRPRPPFPPAM